MNHEIDLKKYNIRTDLVIDSVEDSSFDDIKSISLFGDVKVTRIRVDNKISSIIGKKVGNYVTIEFDDVTDSGNRKNVMDIFARELGNIFDISKANSVLVIGLGNRDSTADSLGPKCVDGVIVTRHLFVLKESVSDNYKCTAAFCPGVMASSGIESLDIVSLLIRDIKPDLVIVIDALAAKKIDRINRCIQITDSGICPGSGIGNRRKEISFDKLHVPVIAIGIPTVVESSIIVYDTIDYLFRHISYIKNNMDMNKLIVNRNNYKDKINDINLSDNDKRSLAGILGEISDEEKMNLINEVLNALDYNFIVTPKEIDFVIVKLASVISGGINCYLHGVDVSS